MASHQSYRIRGDVQEVEAPLTHRVAILSPRRLVSGARREAGAGAVDLGADELVRVTLANGFTLWTRADDLLHERGTRGQARGGEAVWDIDMGPPARVQGGTRGWLGLGIQAIELFGVDLKGMTARRLGVWLEERQLGRPPGLYACSLDDDLVLTPVAKDGLAADQGPCLIFIHGTGSSCQGSFGALWAPENKAGKAAREAFKARYGQRVYAWEHRSLTESPISNALALASLLPYGADLDLVTHSRGGLVGELLCLGQRERNPDPLGQELLQTLFAADRTVAEQLGLKPLDKVAMEERERSYGADRTALNDLLAVLDKCQPKIRRYVRTACPARGTTLASGRLDRWLSVLDYLGGVELLGDALDFLLAVVKERTDPRTLPGLEAMMPGSALTRLLNHPDLVTGADLTVIAGDTEGESTWGQLKLFVADWFYGADHDLVVNTGSMLGGLRRHPDGARFQRDQGPEVNHFRYFGNERSVRWLMAGLGRVDGADGGFRPIAAALPEAPRWRDAVRRSRAAGRPQPLVVVIPGTMGSALQVQGREVWLDYWALLRGGLSRLRLDTGSWVEPVDLLDAFYGPLLAFLARSHRVEVFPYDWRLSVRDAARQLARRLEDWLPEAERAQQPAHLVAHSMGGLVVRAMIADGGAGASAWRRIAALPASRLLMLGTPNLGSYEALRWLTGTNPTLAKLGLLDLTQGTDGIIDIVRAYPGLLELLPWGADDPDFSRPQFWKDLRRDLGAVWSTATAATLRQARDTWAVLRQATLDPQRVVYVAGCQAATVTGYALAPYEESHLAGRKRLSFLATAQGDGTVTWKSGALPGVATWYVQDTAHDALCTRKAAFPAYLDLLMTGKTTRLSQIPPGQARDLAGAAASFPLPAVAPLDAIPDEAEVSRLGFGPGEPLQAAAESALPLIRVSIRHGNLAYARHPVLVGHYLGDTIVNAERALDIHLGGILSRRLQLGLYPGQRGTHALFLNERPRGRPAGAMVIGLGQVGALSPGLIENEVRDAVLDYALRITELPDDRFGDPKAVRSAALTCLLVGSGSGGVTITDSVEAILRGAVAAAGRLTEAGLDDRVVIDRIELVELYQDIAIAAAEALERVLEGAELAERVVWEMRVIDEGKGGLRRLRCEEPAGWWQRLEIIEEAQTGILRFIASTDRARAEVSLATGQLRLADAFIAQASRSEKTNTEVSKTLFEMLLPTQLREMAHRQDDLVVLVDEVSARFPWELLEDRWSHAGRPPAVTAGLVRQLKTPDYRPHPTHATAAKALVIGNPDLDGWSEFADLPGAREEATRVAQLLRDQGFQVLDVIDEGSEAILHGLHKDAWRILHLAGHGVHEHIVATRAGSDCPACGQAAEVREARLSGMVIGKDTLLAPGDVEQMRWVPELVFVNCCHLGKTRLTHAPRYNWLAANLAVQFIRMGVKAVVAAGWAVDDRAGHAFAEGFYARLLAGEQFGDAIRAAREDVWTRYPDVNTWGAYQCYGDPSYRMRGEAASALGPAVHRYHSPGELVADLGNQSEAIRMQIRDQGEDAETLAWLRQGIDALLAGIPDDQREAWLARADVAAAVGFACGETRAYAEAVAWLDKALGANAGDCPLRVLEERNSFRIRLVGERWQAMRGEPEGPEKEDRRQALVDEIDESIRELAAVCQRAPSTDRLTLLASACRRLAWLETHERGRLEALVNMARYCDLAIAQAGGADPLRFPNWLAAKVFAARLDPRDTGALPADLADTCRQMIERAAALNADHPSFRHAIAEADNETALLLTLGEGQGIAAGTAERIADIYRAAFRRGASPRQVAGVLDDLDFLIALGHLLPAPVSAALAAIRRAL